MVPSIPPPSVPPAVERIEQLARPHREFRDFWWVEGGPPLSTKLRYLLRYQFKPCYFVRPPGWRVALRGLSWKQRPPPDFASIGAVRSGTSALSEYIFQHLNRMGIPTHFIRRLNMREQLVREVEIIPLELVVRDVNGAVVDHRSQYCAPT